VRKDGPYWRNGFPIHWRVHLGLSGGAVFVSKALDTSMGGNDELWLRPKLYWTFAFSDYVDTDGTPRTSWTEFDGPLGGGGNSGGSGSTNNSHAYPEDWAFLFKDLRGNLRPPEPALSPQQTAVKDNLRKIMDAASVYMLNNDVNTVTVQQLTSGPQPLLKPINPVAGENYSDLIIHNTDSSISVDIPGQGAVKFIP